MDHQPHKTGSVQSHIKCEDSDDQYSYSRYSSKGDVRVKKEPNHSGGGSYRHPKSKYGTHDKYRLDTDYKESQDVKPPIEKELPNYKPSGLLALESKTQAGGKVLKYHAPSDSTMPTGGQQFRVYVFENAGNPDPLDVFVLNQKEWYLFGRDKELCDVPVDIASCSSQHAVIQFRKRYSKDMFGQYSETVKPYVMDIDSSYGTLLNGEEIPKSRYVELRHKDVLQFASHPREYLFMVDSEVSSQNSK